MDCQLQLHLLLPALLLPPMPQHVNLALSVSAAARLFAVALSAALGVCTSLTRDTSTAAVLGPAVTSAGAISEEVGTVWPAEGNRDKSIHW